MSTSVIHAEAVMDADGTTRATHTGCGTYAYNNLGSWALQRFPYQRGCWFVSVFLRGLSITFLAVQDDFGNLIAVEAS